jgi:amino acid adenylation domain-containing protein
VCGAEQLTYRELNERANQLGRYLLRAGVAREARVGVLLERSAAMIWAVLGVLKAGAAYVPLEVTNPQLRMQEVIADAGIGIVLSTEKWRQTLAEAGVKVICLDGPEGTAVAREDVAAVAEKVAPENLAYVIYTSGSTGKPKGVMVQHGSLVNHSQAIADRFQLGPTDRVLQFASLSFDVAAEEIFPSLLNGCSIFVNRGSTSGSITEFLNYVTQARLTVLNLPGSFWHEWVSELSSTTFPPALRLIIVGSEPVLTQPLTRWRQLTDGRVNWLNAYGTTEATITSTIYEPSAGLAEGHSATVSIGKPIGNTRVYLLDRALQLVPAGVGGEIYVSGEGLARGYLNEAALTAEKFVPDPYSGEAGARMYRTGDVGRYLAGGEIEFLGRVDEQVKIRGYRIEPGEVETALAAHEQVRQVVVVKHEGRAGDQRLVAYVVRGGAGAVSRAELRSFLQARLPEYLIPSMFIWLEAIPLTTHGKVDRRSLAERDLSEVTPMAEAHSAPRTLVEELLAEIWSEVLGLERVGVTDSFFALGGHSLLAIQLISRIRGAFGIDLELRSLFERPTIAGLAEEIERRLGTGSQFSSPPIERLPRNGPAPLSFAQQRLWILDHLTPGHPVYNIPFAITIRGALNIAALSASLNEIVKRHEVLRARVIISNGQPQQAIAPALDIPLPLVDLSNLSYAERYTNARRLATEEGSRQFDLSTGPLLRASLFKLAADEHVLVLTVHHIVFDGWSLEILLRELAAFYKDFSIGNRSTLPELPIQYADYASWQRDWLRGDVLERQLGFWRERLKGAPPGLNLPSRQARPAVQTFIGGRLPFALSTDLYERLKTLTRNERATLFMTLLAGFKALLYRYTGETDVMVGTVVAGRNWIETEKLIGFFVNTLVLRTDFSADPSFRTILSRVREVLLEAYAHQDIPFEKVVEELQPERNLSQSPLFQVLFAFHHESASALEVSGLSMDLDQLDTHATKFDLYLSITRSAEGLSGILEYNLDLFDQVTMKRLLEHYRYLLEGTAANPALPISRQPLLLPEEQEMLKQWNDTAADHPRTQSIHGLFERQAQRTPDALALVWGSERITYRDLDQRANQVAHRLQSLGVGPEVVVAVFMDRTPELVVALLAILKAGGAYLPLDPAYPKERIRFMMEDVNAQVLLTEEHLRYSLPENNATVLLPNAPGENRSEDENAPPCAAGPQNLAYLIYTSGSTGRPKAVAIEHRSAVAFLHWAGGKYSRHELSGVLATTSICFDISVFELFAPLSWGGKIILVENALSLLSLNTAEPITLVDIVPSAMAEVLKSTELPASVCTVNLPGEPIPARLIEELYRQPTIERIYNLYGPSEDTTYSTCALAERGASGPPPAGRPISNSHVLLLDREMMRVPVGVQGEIFIGGEGLARGYYDRAEQTADRFVPNPFSHIPGQRLYRTGDLGRYLPDGQIEVLGRLDHQVKIRGFRIELGEIEAALRTHEAVREAVVIARGQGHDKRILAYVVAEPRAVDIHELQSLLTEKLPGYMLPAAIVLLESLPLLPNGKIDRNALPEPNMGGAATDENYVAPRDELEQTIVRVWQEVLGIPRVGVHDNFFSDLGGHSLLAVEAVTRLRECLDPQLSFVDMFHFLTVRSLADHLRGGADSEPSAQTSEWTRQRQEARRRRRRVKQARVAGAAD